MKNYTPQPKEIVAEAWKEGVNAFLFVPSFCFKNVFFIERQGGLISYLLTLLILPLSPFIGAMCGIAEALITIDEHLS